MFLLQGCNGLGYLRPDARSGAASAQSMQAVGQWAICNVLLCQFLRSWHMTCVCHVASLICSVLFWFSTSVRSKSLTSRVLLCARDQRCPLPRLRSHMRLPSFLRKKLQSLNMVRTTMILIAVTWQQFMAARLPPALARRWQGFSGKHLHIWGLDRRLGVCPTPCETNLSFRRDGGQQVLGRLVAFWSASPNSVTPKTRTRLRVLTLGNLNGPPRNLGSDFFNAKLLNFKSFQLGV